MTNWNPQPGDWVTITGQVKELHPNDVDLGVDVFSKTDQYTAFVRRDLCAPTAKPIPDEPADDSVALLGRDAYQRVGSQWLAAGGSSAMSWRELNQRGDVEVIHHG